jgi:hypothetical protein
MEGLQLILGSMSAAVHRSGITRRERINVDSRSSLLKIKRADQVDVLPRIGRNIFDDVGGRGIAGCAFLFVHGVVSPKQRN